MYKICIIIRVNNAIVYNSAGAVNVKQTALIMLWLSVVTCIIYRVSGKYVDNIAECPSLEGREVPPTSVHDLRPDDFKVVMGLGDSMMAGFGAKLFTMIDTELIHEYRGISFAMGGDPHAVTLPGFLQHYRADIVGASRGTHLVELCQGDLCPPDEVAYRPQSDQFNAAQSGAMSGNLGMEAKYLLHQVRHNKLVNVTTDWKLLTVFIGVNDICRRSCKPELKEGEPGSAGAFEAKLLTVLQRIRERLPKTLVVLMELPDASQVNWFAKRHNRCAFVLPFLALECPCAFISEETQWDMRLNTADFNERIRKVAKTLNEDAKRIGQVDFGVTVLPFMRDTDLRDDVPQHFMSKLDCFHPSNTAHKSMARMYWNSLFLKDRATKLVEVNDLYCPTEDDRIRI